MPGGELYHVIIFGQPSCKTEAKFPNYSSNESHGKFRQENYSVLAWTVPWTNSDLSGRLESSQRSSNKGNVLDKPWTFQGTVLTRHRLIFYHWCNENCSIGIDKWWHLYLVNQICLYFKEQCNNILPNFNISWSVSVRLSFCKKRWLTTPYLHTPHRMFRRWFTGTDERFYDTTHWLADRFDEHSWEILKGNCWGLYWSDHHPWSPHGLCCHHCTVQDISYPCRHFL